MSDSFLAAINVVAPMIILMAIGWVCRTRGLIDRPAMKKYDKLIFWVFMPLLLFKNVYEIDFSQGFAVREMTFAAIGLLLNFAFCLTALA